MKNTELYGIEKIQQLSAEEQRRRNEAMNRQMEQQMAQQQFQQQYPGNPQIQQPQNQMNNMGQNHQNFNQYR